MPDRPPDERRPTHAGAVVFRRAAHGPEFLLVRAKRSAEWVLPKGHIEPDEVPPETVRREVWEEAGVEGTLGPALGLQEFEAVGELVRVAWWLMESRSESPSPEGRAKRWSPLEEALRAVRHEQQRELLREAHTQLAPRL